MENPNVFVKSMVSWPVQIIDNNYSINRVWDRKGARIPIPRDTFQALCYTPGVEYMLKQGMLVVEDEQILEDAGFVADNLPKVVLTNEIMDEYLSSARQNWELKNFVKELTYEQRMEFANYAINHNCTDRSKCDTLSMKFDENSEHDYIINVNESIQNNREDA